MPGKRIAEELLPVLTINSTSFAVCLTDLELILKIILLIASIVFTVERWWAYRQRND